MFPRQEEGAGALDSDLASSDLLQRLLAADPEDVDLRTDLALQLFHGGQLDAALEELDKILEINPDNLRARYLRGGILYKRHRDDAERDFSYLLEHPRFEEWLREFPETLNAFYYDSWALLQKGETDKAVRVALRGLEYARHSQNKEIQCAMHYALARAFAVASKFDPEQVQKAAAHMYLAFDHDCPNLKLKQRFKYDLVFEGHREEIALRISKLRDDRE